MASYTLRWLADSILPRTLKPILPFRFNSAQRSVISLVGALHLRLDWESFLIRLPVSILAIKILRPVLKNWNFVPSRYLAYGIIYSTQQPLNNHPPKINRPWKIPCLSSAWLVQAVSTSRSLGNWAKGKAFWMEAYPFTIQVIGASQAQKPVPTTWALTLVEGASSPTRWLIL